MILYFSGTGNSAYTAQKIAENIQDDTLDLFQKIRDNDHTQICSDKPWVIVSPTYAWRIPRILQDWLTKTKLAGNKDIYFILTCGGNIGNAGAYIKKLCTSKNLNLKGVFLSSCQRITLPCSALPRRKNHWRSYAGLRIPWTKYHISSQIMKCSRSLPSLPKTG